MAGTCRTRAGPAVLLGAEEIRLAGGGMGRMAVHNPLGQLLDQLFHTRHHTQDGQKKQQGAGETDEHRSKG